MPATQSTDLATRIKRTWRNGCLEVIQAIANGELGIKTLERISKLPAPAQPKELVRLLKERKANAERQAAWRADPRRGRAVFASQRYAEARARHLRRIGMRASAELQAAYQEGRLSLRAYDQLSKRSPSQQKKAVEFDRNKEQAQTKAAAAIRKVLARKLRCIDLGLVARAIIASIRSVSASHSRTRSVSHAASNRHHH